MRNGDKRFISRYCCVVSLVVIALVLQSCGYHLRGARQLPPQMAVTMVRASDTHSALVHSIRRQLTQSGVRVTAASTDATAVLEVLQDRVTRRVLSVGSTGKVREYELHYIVAYRLVGSDGIEIVPRRQLSLTRNFVFDENDVLGKSNEESQVRTEMQQDLVRLILTSLEAVTT